MTLICNVCRHLTNFIYAEVSILPMLNASNPRAWFFFGSRNGIDFYRPRSVTSGRPNMMHKFVSSGAQLVIDVIQGGNDGIQKYSGGALINRAQFRRPNLVSKIDASAHKQSIRQTINRAVAPMVKSQKWIAKFPSRYWLSAAPAVVPAQPLSRIRYAMC